jgi:nucleoside-diphosphate-sugar epimerase
MILPVQSPDEPGSATTGYTVRPCDDALARNVPDIARRLPQRRRFGRPRLLIVGCGDVGLRCAARLRDRYRIFGLTTQAGRRDALRATGIVPVIGNLDDAASLARLSHIARDVLHLAPPQPNGATDRRTRALLAALTRSVPRGRPTSGPCMLAPRAAWRALRSASAIVPDAPVRFAAFGKPLQRAVPRIVYASTTGVYGNCDGALIDETRPVRPANARAARRVSAERALRRAGARRAARVTIVRIPGIYAENRLPLARLQRGTSALCEADDVYTGHIHADDLAAIMTRALVRGRAQRVVHAVDDTRLKMGDYFDRVADACALPRPPRITRAQAEATLEPTLLSFMRESRQLSNRRLRDELKVRLRYPSVDDFLRERAGAVRQSS